MVRECKSLYENLQVPTSTVPPAVNTRCLRRPPPWYLLGTVSNGPVQYDRGIARVLYSTYGDLTLGPVRGRYTLLRMYSTRTRAVMYEYSTVQHDTQVCPVPTERVCQANVRVGFIHVRVFTGPRYCTYGDQYEYSTVQYRIAFRGSST